MAEFLEVPGRVLDDDRDERMKNGKKKRGGGGGWIDCLPSSSFGVGIFFLFFYTLKFIIAYIGTVPVFLYSCLFSHTPLEDTAALSYLTPTQLPSDLLHSDLESPSYA